MRALSGLNFGTGAPPNIVTNGLVLWLDAANLNSYTGSGTTWRDMSTSVNGATLVNGPIFSSTNGGILDFDGVDEYADLGNPSSSSLNNEYATHEVWVKMDSPNNGLSQQIIARRNTSDGTFTMIKGTANTLALNTRNSSNEIITLVLNTLPSTNWMQIVHSYDGSTVRGYANGSFDRSNSRMSGPLNTGGSFYMQIARATQGTAYLDGKIGVVRVYNRALNDAEILQNFTATRGRYGI